MPSPDPFEELNRQLSQLADQFTEAAKALPLLLKAFEQLTPPPAALANDLLTQARQRSREDLARKRHDLHRKRGKF